VQGSAVEQSGKVEKFKKEAGCFVLLTNVSKEGKMAHSPVEVLKACKDQYGIEQNFGFLKDPVIVNSIFLKKAERIEVLGLVLLISLLIWRLIERAMRNCIEQTQNDLPGWKNRRTARPTSFMPATKFMGIIVLKVGGVWTLNKPLTSQQKEYLHALGIRFDAFTNPKIE
jgi:transposase